MNNCQQYRLYSCLGRRGGCEQLDGFILKKDPDGVDTKGRSDGNFN